MLTHSECKWNADNTLQSCQSINRLINALDYYSENRDNLKKRKVFNKHLLEDYAHLIAEHDKDLYAINNALTACSIATCSFSSRHHRINNEQVEETKDGKLRFYSETMDSLHYHLLHLFDTGMRSINEYKENDDNNEKNENDRFYDEKFAQMIERVNGKRTSSQLFDRFEISNKFNLSNDNDEKNTNTTFSDELIAYLLTTDANKEYALFLKIFLKEQEFDSDAVKADIDLLRANIFKQVKNEKIIASIKHFIAIIKSQSNLFSIGYRFYYWPKYKKMEKLFANTYNINDQSGYKICELYVAAKYANFKEEILN